jgi:hypothetical protein
MLFVLEAGEPMRLLRSFCDVTQSSSSQTRPDTDDTLLTRIFMSEIVRYHSHSMSVALPLSPPRSHPLAAPLSRFYRWITMCHSLILCCALSSPLMFTPPLAAVHVAGPGVAVAPKS